MKTENSSTPAAAARPTPAQSWEIDGAHTTVQFSVRHMMIATVRGHFGKVTGTAVIDDADLARSKVSVEIDPASIDTRDEKRDGHLRSADFFDVEKFPKMTFESTRVERKGDGYAVTGDLTMHGVTKPVTLFAEPPTPTMKNPYGRIVRGASATGKLNRKEWGLGWNATLETGGLLVGEEITLQLDVELAAK